MTRPTTVQEQELEQLQLRLLELAASADETQSAVKSAYCSRDLMRPLVREREALKQQLSILNSQSPRDTVRAHPVERRIAECNREISIAVEPFNKFSESVANIVKQLKSGFRFLPLSPTTKELRDEIEKLPLLNHGLGDDWTEVRDDLVAIRLRVLELAGQSAQVHSSLRIKVPPDTKWENVQMQFLSFETIEITVPGTRRHYNFAELGFADRRVLETPNTAWVLLRELALATNNEIHRPEREPAKIEKAVQALRKRLKELFGMDDDPFRPYRQAKCYAPKFKLSFLNPDAP